MRLLLMAAALVQATTFAPRVLPDGSHIFMYTTTLPISGGEPALIDRIAQQLALSQWCLSGWEITNRTESSGTLIIEGRCKNGLSTNRTSGN